MSYISKRRGEDVDALLTKVEDGSVVIDNTLSALDENSNKPVSGRAVTKETIRLQSQIDNIKPIEITGDVTNAPDEEDITTDANNLLKLKDRPFGKGFGYKILRSDKTFAEQVTDPHTIYEVRYDFDLSEGIVKIPQDCVLKFNGGAIRNGFVVCDNTYIDGQLMCLDAIIRGTVVNNIRFSWIGIYGNNADNNAKFENLRNFGIKEFEIDSDVTFNKGDIILPKGISLFGHKHTITFSCDSATTALIILSEGCYLRDMDIAVGSNEYAGVVLMAHTELNECHRVSLDNISVVGKYNTSHAYQTTALKLVSSNDKTNTDKNYITGCHINKFTARWVQDGIVIECNNKEWANETNFAWLNEIHISDLYVSSTSCGVKTTYIDTTTTNKSDSVGPIYIRNYDYQALVRTALMFEHRGKWDMYIDTGFSYDNIYKGVVSQTGRVFSLNLLGCYETDGEFKDGANTYKLIDSVKVYDKSTYEKLGDLCTGFRFRQGNYNPRNGTEFWSLKPVGTTMVMQYSRSDIKQITYSSNLFSYSEDTTAAGVTISRQLMRQAGDGSVYMMFANNYGVNENKILFDLKRSYGRTQIDNSYGVREIYSWGLTEYHEEGKIVEGKIKIQFQIEGAAATYTEHKKKYNTVNIKTSPDIYMTGYAIIEQSFQIIDDELYVVFKARKIDTSSYIAYSLGVSYNRSITPANYKVSDTGEVTLSNLFSDELKKIDPDFFVSDIAISIDRAYYDIGSSTNRPSIFTSEDKGKIYFDTTLGKPIWWDGAKWVDATGTAV